MENQKLTTEEIQRILKVQQDTNDIVVELGQVELALYNLQIRKEGIKLRLDELRKEELSLGQELTNKYGDGRINLDSGEFIPTTEVE
jgi:hypothetical protein